MRHAVVAVALAALLLGGCATAPRLPAEVDALPRRVELSAVQFFPQQQYQCGPHCAGKAVLVDVPGQRPARIDRKGGREPSDREHDAAAGGEGTSWHPPPAGDRHHVHEH